MSKLLPVVYMHEKAPEGLEVYERTGECTHCGACCWGCPSRENGRCSEYGTGDTYLGGCNVWPTHPSQIEDKPLCGYSFKRIA